MVDGYGFTWPPYKKPYMTSPLGYHVELEVDNFVPYLREWFPAAPAAAENNNASNVVNASDPSGTQAQQPPANGNVEQKDSDKADEDHEILERLSDAEILDKVQNKKLSNHELKNYNESKILKHQLCHVPQNPFCEVCRKAKIKKASAFRHKGPRNVAKKFAERLHADHVTVQDKRDYET